MKFAFSSNAFLRCDLLEAIRVIGEIGYQGIEIMADVPHAYPPHLTDADVRELRTAIRDHGLEISNINAFEFRAEGDTYHPSWIEADPAARKKRGDHTLRCIDLAEKLGAHNISTEPGGPLDGMSYEEGLSLFKEGLESVEARAREAGVKILIEPEPGLLIETSAQFRRLFDGLDASIFGINFDVGHFFCVSEDPCALIPGMKNIIHHYHLEDIAASRVHEHLMLGAGAINIPEVLTTIQNYGYSGYVTVELYTYDRAPEEAARNAFRYLKEWKERTAT